MPRIARLLARYDYFTDTNTEPRPVSYFFDGAALRQRLAGVLRVAERLPAHLAWD